MTRHVVIGTAGHVDHGKTALVKALTGIDTDRWEEEKRRGITIDLGFARLDLPDGLHASIVDVPGHEDFVRNMVAGATGIDVALMVVAADEGVMLQTAEHLAILEFLGVRSGVVAITKADLADDEWLDLVESDVESRLRGSAVAWEAPVRCSALTGQGLDHLNDVLARAAGRAADRSTDDLFRMPIDRVFSIAGAGTVVTGTTWSGTVAVGQEVRILPGTATSRVRSVEVHGTTRPAAEPGRRTALALPGLERSAIARGYVAVADPAWRTTTALDVTLHLLPETKPLGQRTRVRLHLGTAEVLARVTPEAGDIAPGSTGSARLRLEAPVVARWGDRGVLRSYSPMRTIGGCVVADPMPALRPRRPRQLERRLDPDPAARLMALVGAAGDDGVPQADLPVRIGLHPASVEGVITAAGAALLRVGDRLVRRPVVADAEASTLAALQGHHRQRPLDPGMPRELLRATQRSPALADLVLQRLADRGAIALEGGSVRLAGFSPTLSGEAEAFTSSLRTALEQAGPQGLTEQEMATVVPPDRARDLAEYLVRERTAGRIGRDRYYDRRAIERLRADVVAAIRETGRATPAELRDRTGLTRKYLIPVLEWLDGLGVTVRDGDARRLGPAADQAATDS
jgi:selenocysteine-specific elongation factor